MTTLGQCCDLGGLPAEQVIVATQMDVCSLSRFDELSFFVEAAIFSWLRRMADTYKGGHWKFYELSNGGFYMAPKSTADYTMLSMNGFSAAVSPDVAGIVTTLFALSHLSLQLQSDALGEQYHRLYAFALQHADASTIIRLID